MNDLKNFKQFCEKNYGFKLSPIQEKMFEALKNNDVTFTIYLPRRSGLTTFNKLAKEYLKSQGVLRDGRKTETRES